MTVSRCSPRRAWKAWGSCGCRCRRPPWLPLWVCALAMRRRRRRRQPAPCAPCACLQPCSRRWWRRWPARTVAAVQTRMRTRRRPPCPHTICRRWSLSSWRQRAATRRASSCWAACTTAAWRCSQMWRRQKCGSRALAMGGAWRRGVSWGLCGRVRARWWRRLVCMSLRRAPACRQPCCRLPACWRAAGQACPQTPCVPRTTLRLRRARACRRRWWRWRTCTSRAWGWGWTWVARVRSTRRRRGQGVRRRRWRWGDCCWRGRRACKAVTPRPRWSSSGWRRSRATRRGWRRWPSCCCAGMA
mmetsp:Transcript_53001/g.133274  ORF Transcript_53001/g.133274 Transcript_53001/m.133274 type:complete len:301 (-) Transcript_53001:164-1066(-)